MESGHKKVLVVVGIPVAQTQVVGFAVCPGGQPSHEHVPFGCFFSGTMQTWPQGGIEPSGHLSGGGFSAGFFGASI